MGFSRWSSFLLAAFALSTAAHAQTTLDTYRLTDIAETFGIVDPVSATDINENGEMSAIIGGFPQQRQRSVLLRDGMVIELGDLSGGAAPITQAWAINDLTQITGTSSIPDAAGDPDGRGFLWEAGEMRDLGNDPNISPRDINNRGQIVGFTIEGAPILWEDGRTTFLEGLPCASSQFGLALTINENGVIGGQRTGSFDPRCDECDSTWPLAVVWRDGEVIALLPPFPLEFDSFGEAVDVNDRNDVIGNYANQNDLSNVTAVLWRDDVPTELPPLDLPEGDHASIASSINNEGQIVGATGFSSEGRAVATLWQEGEVVNLNALISDDDPLKPFVTLTFGAHIIESGVILAFGEDSREPEVERSYLLTPTGVPFTVASPPPSSSDSRSGGGAVDLLSLLFLMLGLSSLARSQRVRRA